MSKLPEISQSHLYFERVLEWLKLEREHYQPVKFDYEGWDNTNTRKFQEQYVVDEGWKRQVESYLHRAFTLGLDTEVGRQAVMKLAATAVAFAESVVHEYGDPPAPGVSSGEIVNWMERDG